MKSFIKYINEKLIINKDTDVIKREYYILLGVYEGYDYLCQKFGDMMITGDNGSGYNIFIVSLEDLEDLLKINIEYIEDQSITIWKIPDKYDNDIKKFQKDFENGKVNLDDDCWELSDDEIYELIH